LIYWLRANTYKENGYELEFKCGECKKFSTYNFTLDTLNIKTLTEEEFVKLESDIELPISKMKMKFKLLTVKDEKEIR